MTTSLLTPEQVTLVQWVLGPSTNGTVLAESSLPSPFLIQLSILQGPAEVLLLPQSSPTDPPSSELHSLVCYKHLSAPSLMQVCIISQFKC